jgi:hypothetical protein
MIASTILDTARDETRALALPDCASLRTERGAAALTVWHASAKSACQRAPNRSPTLGVIVPLTHTSGARPTTPHR